MFTIYFVYYTNTVLISCVITKHATNAKRVVVLFILLYLNIYLKYQLYVIRMHSCTTL